VIAALWVIALAQGGAPVVTATVDRTRLGVGDALVLTIRARTRSPQPLKFTLPALPGFAIIATHEVSDVSLAGGVGAAMRTTVRQLTLRAERAGTLVIGPVRVQQGTKVFATRAISVTADSATGPVAALSPAARGLLDAAPVPPPPIAPPLPPPSSAAPSGDDVALTVLLPGDTVLVGQQLDLVVAAWFPRDLRLRLRGPPRLTLATPPGVWSYPAERPQEPVAARLVRGRWMDVYVLHQILFPLEAAPLVIPPASVEYGVPVSFSIFSREERYALHSDSVALTVLPPPAAGRPGDDRQVAGEGLTLALSVTPAETRVGEPITVLATVSGIGNAALWPEPVLRWPAGFRAYQAETNTAIEPQGGLVAGSKAFSYLVVPDSAGTFVLPEVRYPYYDVAAGSYAVARAAPQTLAVQPGPEPRAARALPPLLASEGEQWPDAVARELGGWGWAALLLGPPLVAGWQLRRRGRERVAPPVGSSAPSHLGRLERAFHTLLASHVSDLATRDGDGLARALRAAGIERAVADHVMRLRDRLRAARYGPQGLGDAAELAAELEQVLQVLGAEPGGRGGGAGLGRRRIMAALLWCGLVASRGGVAQAPAASPGAEALYEAGALRAAADSFAERAAQAPGTAAHWYNLGATLYRAGADGKAVAAWTIALRLAPRDRVIQRARALLPLPDPASDALLAVGPATPAEWALAAALGWMALWVAVLARRRRLTIGVLAGLAAAAATLGALERRRRDRPLAVVVTAASAIRVAPYGSATATTTLDAGAALEVAGRYGRWLEVRRHDGVRGWVLDSDVVRL